MAYVVQAGSKVRYRNADGRVRPATVTAVTDQETIDLRVGNGATKRAEADVAKVARKGVTVGWFQGAR